MENPASMCDPANHSIHTFTKIKEGKLVPVVVVLPGGYFACAERIAQGHPVKHLLQDFFSITSPMQNAVNVVPV